MFIRRQTACSEHVAHQSASGGKCGNAPLYAAIKDATSRFRCQRVSHYGGRKTALANTWFAQQGHGAAFAAHARQSFTKRRKFGYSIHHRILIAASDVVMIDIVWPGIQRVDLDHPIGDPRRRLVHREVQWRSEKLCGFGANPDFAWSRLLLQLGRNVHRRAGNVKASDRVGTTYAQADQAGVNPDAKIDRISPRSGRLAKTLNVPGSNARTIRMILICGWPAKYGNATVSCIVDNLSPERLHGITDVIQPLVQKRLSLVGIASRDVAS
jgi:hypothetical protein